MMYHAYQAYADAMAPLRCLAQAASGCVPLPVSAQPRWLRGMAAAYQLFADAALSHQRPSFGIDSIPAGNGEVAVVEEAVDRTPFCTLLRFRKQLDAPQPAVLLVAPLSGHFATLLRDTVRTMLPEHDVYITDWHNARDVPLSAGRFGLDEFITHLIRFLERIGPDSHIVAICQPCVAAIAAVAIMAEDGNPAQPRSMTLMAGPIDTRVNPTKVNEFAGQRSSAWFEQNLITVVPAGYRGALRRVYPGFLQLSAFMTMNLGRHMKSCHDIFNDWVKGEPEKSEPVRRFYDEYLAVMDLPGEFYLETVRKIFQEHELARGVLKWRGRTVDPSAIRRTQLLTVEGERDDICAMGQTLAAHDLLSRLRPYRKRHYVQTGAGHYGVFSGRRWSLQVYPMVRDIIHTAG